MRKAVIAGIAGLVIAGSIPALAQFTLGRAGFAPGVTDPVDSVLARRVTMTTVNQFQDRVHDILDGLSTDTPDNARLYLDTMSAMLLTLPELFPEGSLIYSPEAAAAEPGSVSLALGTVWTQWDDFYSRALESSDIAYRAGRTADPAALLVLAEELEATCESCHAIYRRPAEAVDPETLGLGPVSE